MMDSRRADATRTPGTAHPGKLAGMDPVALIDYLRDELRQSGHPTITDVSDLDSPGVQVVCDDGIKVYTKIAWLGRGDQRPSEPHWPTREDLTRAGARR